MKHRFIGQVINTSMSSSLWTGTFRNQSIMIKHGKAVKFLMSTPESVADESPNNLTLTEDLIL
jgi:hypothetical protein